MQGTVVAVHSGGLYRVQVDAGHEVLAQLSGRMRRFRIKVVPGDRVTVGVSPYDPSARHHHLPRPLARNTHLNSRPTSSRRPRRRGASGGGSRRSGRAGLDTAPRTAPPPTLDWQTVDAAAPPVPFASLDLDTRLAAGLRDLGFEGTRPVQSAVIPLALAGHDVIACAETGTGKTLAFAAPILQRLLREQPHYGDPAREAYTRALILAPTRELAVQIEDTLAGLTYHTPVHQRRRLRRRRDGPAGARAQGRRRHHRRHARPADGSHAARRRRPAARAGAGARRSRPHDGHGLLARRPAHHVVAAAGSADAALLGDDARRDPADGHRDAARAEVRAGRHAAAPAKTIRHERQTVEGPDKIDWLAKFIKQDADRPGAGVRADEDRRRTRDAAPAGARASGPRRCTPIARSTNGWPRSKASAPGSTRCWWPPTSRRAASTSTASRTSSTTKCRTRADTYVHRVGRTGRSGASGHAVTLVSPAEERNWRSVEQSVGFDVL